ncbi:MAG: hypothetical protein GYB35_03845 [Algicola sp.]|nr:hypothetical protein [Algicola sp.]
MKTLKNTQTLEKNQNTMARIFQSLLVVAVFLIASDIYGQSKEVEFDVYTNSATQATQYLMADDVALRDCASVHCEKLTTITIGTRVRLLAKSETPQTINGVTSRFYKIKMGPQVGWIWGGLISQKTMVSQINPEIKFVFGEAGKDYKGYKRFQLRAVRNGVELDKIFVKSEDLSHDLVNLIDREANTYGVDVISLCSTKGEPCNDEKTTSFIVFKNNKLMQTSTLVALEKVKSDKESYAFTCELDN